MRMGGLGQRCWAPTELCRRAALPPEFQALVATAGELSPGPGGVTAESLETLLALHALLLMPGTPGVPEKEDCGRWMAPHEAWRCIAPLLAIATAALPARELLPPPPAPP